MGTQNGVRVTLSHLSSLCDAHVQRREFVEAATLFITCCRDDGRPTIIAAGRFSELVKAISLGDRAAADTILRSWGIRR